ncbi:MAG: rod shape-determining protein MreD [Candidatus Omnitrophica bacterium]|nr:rod shape-determining protein MreD [Candidatus Omnitrophota bacterium]
MRFFSNRRIILVLAVFLWFELSLLPFFSIRQIKPEVGLIFLVFYAFRINWKSVVKLAFLIGILEDLITNSFFGLHTASYMGGALLVQFFAIRLDREKRWIHLASLFSVSWFSLLLYLLFAFLVQDLRYWDERIFLQTFFIAIYTTAVGFFLFPLFEKWLLKPLQEKQYELF